MHADIFTDEFAQAAAAAGLNARREALAGGHAVVFVDDLGRCVEERPDGTLREILLLAGSPRDAHIQILGALTARTPSVPA